MKIVKLRANRGKNARFNSINKFGHNVARLLPLNLLNADLRSANLLSNAEAKSQGRSTQRLRTSPKFNWMP